MRTEIEALKEIRDRISYFCSRTDGKYDPPWAQEVIGIIDDVLITPYRRCKRFGAPFYVEVGTSIVAIRCASNHDVVWRADHSVHGKATVDWAESVCTRMNQEAHIRELSKNVSKNGADFGQLGDAAKLREAAVKIIDYLEPIRRWTMPTKEYGTEPTALFAAVDTVYEMATAALAAPARICDVLGEEAMINIVKSETGKHVPMATDHERKIAEMAATAALATAYATVSIKESEATDGK